MSAVDPDEDTVISYFDTMSNWGRWGHDDELGALNLITAAKVASATALVCEGIRISCARLIEFAPKPSPVEAAIPPLHFMQRAGEAASTSGMDSAYDWAGLPLHGLYVTHLDAPSHIFWRGLMYNGREAHDVHGDRGATSNAVDAVSAGVFTRGVMLDIPRARGVMSLGDREGITSDDLLAAEERQGVTVSAGDALLVRTGYGARRPGHTHETPGLCADALTYLRDREPALVATDTGTDVYPSGYESMVAPVHAVCLVAMGVWIIDNCDLERAAATSEELKRWEFLFSAAPLRLKNSTGSPINPTVVW